MKIRTRFATTLLMGAICIGCRQPPPPKKTYFVDPAPVNALVPAHMDRLLEFESRDVVSGIVTKVGYTLPIPKAMRDTYLIFHTNDELNYGHSSMSVEPSCDELYCVPEDPNDAIDREFGLGKLARTPRPEDAWKIVRDERRDHQRVLVFEYEYKDVYHLGEEGPAKVIIATWKKGGQRYHRCDATLDVEIKEAIAAFQKACELMVVHE